MFTRKNYLLIFLLDLHISRRTEKEMEMSALLFAQVEDAHGSVSVRLGGVDGRC